MNIIPTLNDDGGINYIFYYVISNFYKIYEVKYDI